MSLESLTTPAVQKLDAAIAGTSIYAISLDQANAATVAVSTLASIASALALKPVAVPNFLLLVVDVTGKTITGPIYDTTLFGIIAQVTGAASVGFDPFADAPAHIEGSAPYSLLGNVGSTINVKTFPAGTYTAKAHQMSGTNGTGSVLAEGSVTVVVAKSAAPTPVPPVVNAAQYVIDEKLWPKALKGLQNSRYGVPLPLPGTTTGPRVPKSLMTAVKASDLKLVSGTPENPKVYERLIISGMLKLDGLHDIEVRDCIGNAGRIVSTWTVIVAGDPYCISASGCTNINIHHNDLGYSKSACIYGDGITATYNTLHHVGGDTMKLQTKSVARYNYCTMGGYGDIGAHSDGNQTIAGHDVTIEYNFFDFDLRTYPASNFKANAVMQLQKNNSVSGSGNYNIKFNRNWCRGSHNGIWFYDVLKPGSEVIENLIMDILPDDTTGKIGSGLHVGTNTTVKGNVNLVGLAIAA